MGEQETTWTIPKLNLARIEALAEKASPGEWVTQRFDEYNGDIDFQVESKNYTQASIIAECSEFGDSNNAANAAFIADTRQSVPALAAKLREARAIMKEFLVLAEHCDLPVLAALSREFLNSISWEDEGDETK